MWSVFVCCLFCVFGLAVLVLFVHDRVMLYMCFLKAFACVCVLLPFKNKVFVGFVCGPLCVFCVWFVCVCVCFAFCALLMNMCLCVMLCVVLFVYVCL